MVTQNMFRMEAATLRSSEMDELRAHGTGPKPAGLLVPLINQHHSGPPDAEMRDNYNYCREDSLLPTCYENTQLIFRLQQE